MGRPLQIPWQDDEATLFHWYRTEKLPDLRPRLQALWLLRKGYGLRETAQVVGVHYVTLQQWVAWYRQGGVAAVRAHRKAGLGLPAWLAQEQQAQFRDQVAQGQFHTGRDAQQWVENTFGIRYQLGGMYSLLTRLKGRKKVPRPQATNTSLEAQEEWKRGGLRAALADAGVSKDNPVGWADEMRLGLLGRVRRVWGIRGIKIRQKVECTYQ